MNKRNFRLVASVVGSMILALSGAAFGMPITGTMANAAASLASPQAMSPGSQEHVWAIRDRGLTGAAGIAAEGGEDMSVPESVLDRLFGGVHLAAAQRADPIAAPLQLPSTGPSDDPPAPVKEPPLLTLVLLALGGLFLGRSHRK